MIRTEVAPAKVNPVLLVGPLEASGYHALRTLFCALELADDLAVRLEEAGGEGSVHLAVEGAQVGPDHENLAFRAAQAFLEAAERPGSVSIRLRKRIPAGGGLGGGSSDAAAVLRALNRLLPGAVAPERLMTLAATLGSDVPFFLKALPLVWGTGRGDRLEPVPSLPSVPVLLVFPGFPIATAEAYRWLDQDRGATAALPGPPEAGTSPGPTSWEATAGLSCNDFEPAVFRRHPELARMRDALAESGATIARLSGSGSTLFGIFPADDIRDRAVASITERFPWVETSRTRTAPNPGD